MRKFYTLLGAIALGVAGLTANAQTLPEGTITSGLIVSPNGNYMTGGYYNQDIELQYYIANEAQDIYFVDCQTEEEDDVTTDYINVTLTGPGSTTQTIKAVIGQNYSWGPLSRAQGTDVGPKLIFQLQDLDPLTEGSYSITLDAGVVTTEEGLTNPAQTISWTMKTEMYEIYDSMISPEPLYDGTPYTQSELSAVTITFEEGLTLTKSGAGSITYTVTEGWEEITNVLSENLINVSGNVMTLDLSSLPENSYSFEIPTGYLLVGDNGVNAFVNFAYTIWNGLPSGDVVYGPAAVGVYPSNIEIYYGEDIEFVSTNQAEWPAVFIYEDWYFPGETPAYTVPAANLSIETITTGEGGSPDISSRADETQEIQVLYIDITSILNGKQGTFIVVVPEGLVKNEAGKMNPEKQIEFRLSGYASVRPTLSISDNGVVSIVWQTANRVSSANSDGEAVLVAPDGTQTPLTYDEMGWFGGEITPNDNYDGVTVDLTELLSADGEYQLIIPEAYFQVSFPTESYDGISREIVYDFTYENGKTSRIEAIGTVTPAIEGVYNLQGVKVGNSLEGLARGIYVVNGKKVVVR